jgi:hypothetical protein
MTKYGEQAFPNKWLELIKYDLIHPGATINEIININYNKTRYKKNLS